MDPEELYHAWKQRRRRTEAPAGFADRVLASIQAGSRSEETAAPPAASLWRFASWTARVAVCTLAGVACLFRMGSFIALFIPG
jgi:hypothetical protein